MLRKLVTTFVAGLLALLPLLITILIVGFVVGKLNAWLGPGSAFGVWLAGFYPHVALSYGVSLAAALVLILLVGVLAKRMTGWRVTRLLDSLIARIPLINKVYKSVEQIVGLMSKQGGTEAAALSNVVLAQIANVRVLGMLSSPDPVVIEGEPHFIVYFPSTPIPASGQNVLVPCKNVEDVDVTVEELTKILFSLGSLGPAIMNEKQPLILPALK